MSEKLTCPVCGYPNEPGGESCENCGAELLQDEPMEAGLPEAEAPPAVEAGIAAEYAEVDIAAEEEPAAPAPKAAAAPLSQKPAQAKQKPPPKQPPPRKPAALQPELFVRNGIVRIQLRIWQAIAFAALGIAAIVVIISYVMDSTGNRPGEVAQQQMPAGGDQAPEGPSLEQINQARQEVEASPNDPAALLRLSHLLHDAGMFDQAVVTYQRYIRIVPDNPDAQVDLGVCYYSLGQFDDAIREMKAAVARHPDHQLGNFNLGIVTVANGDTAEARQWLNKAIALDPDNTISQNAKNLLSKLDSGL